MKEERRKIVQLVNSRTESNEMLYIKAFVLIPDKGNLKVHKM